MRTVPDAALLGLMPLDMRAAFGDVEGPINVPLADGLILHIPNGRLASHVDPDGRLFVQARWDRVGRLDRTPVYEPLGQLGDVVSSAPLEDLRARLNEFLTHRDRQRPWTFSRIRARLRGCDCASCRARGIVNP